VEWKDKKVTNWKEFRMKRLWLRYDPGIYLEGLSKTTKISVGIAGLRDEI
jgi:hypothetical protein